MAGTSEGAKKGWDARGRGRKAQDRAADRGKAKLQGLLTDPVYAALHAASWNRALETARVRSIGRKIGARLALNPKAATAFSVRGGHYGQGGLRPLHRVVVVTRVLK